jgi:HTH-type transcriptional regulator / antitoxin HigA
VRTEAELDEAINMVNYLIDRMPLYAGEKDYFDVLGGLIKEYEDKHIIFEKPSALAMLRHLIEAKGVTQAQVAKDCRIAASTVSEILAGTRKMNRDHIVKFAAYFHVGPGVFFGD